MSHFVTFFAKWQKLLMRDASIACLTNISEDNQPKETSMCSAEIKGRLPAHDQWIRHPLTICRSVRSLPYFSHAPPLHPFGNNEETTSTLTVKEALNHSIVYYACNRFSIIAFRSCNSSSSGPSI